MESKRLKCYYKESCAAKNCEDCEPSLKPRTSTCFHYYCPPGVCFLDGGACTDGFRGKPCDCYVDKSTRPSENHVFDIRTGKWRLGKKEKNMPKENNEEQLNLKEDIHSCLKVIDAILDDFYDVCEQEDPEAEKFVRDMATKYGFTELIHEQSN